ncbi:MAG: tetratricopeptide repeat protein, partial [Spirochaetota bacterium]
KAATFRKGDRALADLSSFIQLGLGDTAAARKGFEAVLAGLPNDLDARFGLALLDLAAGKKTEARSRLEDSLRVSPQNARALLSLALIALDQGRNGEAASLVEKALATQSSDARVQLVAARLAASRGDRAVAIFHAKNAIELQPDKGEARRLLGSLLFAGADFEGTAALMRESVARNRKDQAAWFTLGLAQRALGKTSEAIYSLETALGILPDDEVARISLENLVVDSTPLEAAQRQTYADWHVAKGREFEDRSYFDQALVEYKRALRIYPYSVQGRARYAELLRKRGYPAKQLSELRFLESIGKADRNTLDAIEIYASLLSDSVGLAWGLDQYALQKRPYRIALFIQGGQPTEFHTDAGTILLRYLSDILASTSRLRLLVLPPRVSAQSEAFRLAREAEADYYLLFTLQETEREIQLGGELRVGRTGSLATNFRSFRTGNDRVKNTTIRLADTLVAALQPKGAIMKRNQDMAVIDLGSSDGVKVGDRFTVIKKGALTVKSEGLGPSWQSQAVVGSFTVAKLDEEVASGTLKSSGFFDTINVGDEIVATPPEPAKAGAKPVSAPPKTLAEPEFPGLYISIKQLR